MHLFAFLVIYYHSIYNDINPGDYYDLGGSE